MEKTDRQKPLTRDAFSYLTTIQTRWSDNDIYGHVNNAAYYFYFDTIVNNYLIHQGALDINQSDIIGLVVETGCTYFSALKFPQIIEAGLRITKIGRSSVAYQIGLFSEGLPQTAAVGRFVHVYVDRESRRPVTLPDKLRGIIEKLSD